jgi:hypothetical protein
MPAMLRGGRERLRPNRAARIAPRAATNPADRSDRPVLNEDEHEPEKYSSGHQATLTAASEFEVQVRCLEN